MTETINLIVQAVHDAIEATPPALQPHAVWCGAGVSVLNGALIERVVTRLAEWRDEWKCLCHLKLNQLLERLLHKIAYREDLFIINAR